MILYYKFIDFLIIYVLLLLKSMTNSIDTLNSISTNSWSKQTSSPAIINTLSDINFIHSDRNAEALAYVQNVEAFLRSRDLIDPNHDITAILKITKDYIISRQMSSEMTVNAWIIDIHHATFYVYLPFILLSLIQEKPNFWLFLELIRFIDRYVVMHFDCEVSDLMLRKKKAWEDYKNYELEMKILPWKIRDIKSQIEILKPKLKEEIRQYWWFFKTDNAKHLEQQISELEEELKKLEQLLSQSSELLSNAKQEMEDFVKSCDEHRDIHNKIISWWNLEIMSIVKIFSDNWSFLDTIFDNDWNLKKTIPNYDVINLIISVLLKPVKDDLEKNKSVGKKWFTMPKDSELIKQFSILDVISNDALLKHVISKTAEFYEIVTKHIKEIDTVAFRGEWTIASVRTSNRIIAAARADWKNIHSFATGSVDLF